MKKKMSGEEYNFNIFKKVLKLGLSSTGYKIGIKNCEIKLDKNKKIFFITSKEEIK